MKPIRLAFLWHMHQPLYRINGEKVCFMPWTRLHSIRSYYDMVRVLEEFPSVRVTVNLVPSLLDQIEAYNNGATDTFLELTQRSIEDCGDSERAFFFDHFFSSNYKQMIGTLPRYTDLLERRTRLLRSQRSEPWKEFSDEDFLDLQALFDLSWFGFKAREDFPEIQHFLKKGSGFSSEDVEKIQNIEKEILKRILPLYRAAQERGQIEITCSPYAHPILPLVVNTESAREAWSEVPLPPTFNHPEDAERQVREALQSMEIRFGVRPKGMWPSEGSVSHEVALLLTRCGVQWAASDEEVLARSQYEGRFSPYRAWEIHDNGHMLAMVFRDRELSDRIGFSYAQRDPQDAVKDFLSTLISKNRNSDREGSFALVALDGENPWEHYPQAGSSFLRTLYGELSKHKEIFCTTVSGALADGVARSCIHRLHAGSWIHGNFGIWIGGPEKNRAWTVLGKCRHELGEALQRPDLSEEIRNQVWNSIRAAEGSDWFWWLDGQFATQYRAQLDEIFRGHLKKAYEVLGLEPPEFLSWFIPAARVMSEGISDEPFEWLEPTIDGFVSDMFEWHGAFQIPWRKLNPDATMHRNLKPIQNLWVGFHEGGNLLLRIDPSRSPGVRLFSNLEVELVFRMEDIIRRILLRLNETGDLVSGDLWLEDKNQPSQTKAAARKVLEIQIPREEMGLLNGKTGTLIVQLRTSSEEWVLKEVILHSPDSLSLVATEGSP